MDPLLLGLPVTIDGGWQRQTYLTNVLIDLRQTEYMGRYNFERAPIYREKNRTWRPFIEGSSRGFSPLFIGTHFAIDAVVRSLPDYLRPWVYTALSISSSLTTSSNARLTGQGYGVVFTFSKRF